MTADWSPSRALARINPPCLRYRMKDLDTAASMRSDNPIAGNREVDAGDLVILGRVIWIGREA